MRWLRPHREPRRVPHPDPRIELQLQRILSVRGQETRAVTAITDYQDAIAALIRLNRDLSEQAANPGGFTTECRRQIALNKETIRELQQDIRALNDAIMQGQELITVISKDLTSGDLEAL